MKYFVMILASTLVLLLFGCSRDPLIGKWKVVGAPAEAMQTFNDNGTFSAQFSIATPFGTLGGTASGDYSATQTTVTTSAKSVNFKPVGIADAVLAQIRQRLDRQLFGTQVIQIRWLSSDEIAATAGTGQQFTMQRVK